MRFILQSGESLTFVRLDQCSNAASNHAGVVIADVANRAMNVA